MPKAVAGALASLELLELELDVPTARGSLLLPPSLRRLNLSVGHAAEAFDLGDNDEGAAAGGPVCLALDMARHPRLHVRYDEAALAVGGRGAPYVGEEGARGRPLRFVCRLSIP